MAYQERFCACSDSDTKGLQDHTAGKKAPGSAACSGRSCPCLQNVFPLEDLGSPHIKQQSLRIQWATSEAGSEQGVCSYAPDIHDLLSANTQRWMVFRAPSEQTVGRRDVS